MTGLTALRVLVLIFLGAMPILDAPFGIGDLGMDHIRFTRAIGVVALVAAFFVSPRPAHAGGYDTPMLYSARHQAMGGTAVSYVDDPSALFHNPAGLAGIERGELLLNATLLLGTITGSPREDQQSIDSDLTVAPFPLFGGAVRVLDMDWGGLVIGAGAFPIASAAGTYHYCEGGDVQPENDSCSDGSPYYTDETTLLFIEVTPAVAMNINLGNVGELRLGAAWRATYVSLSRYRGDESVGPYLDTNGLDFSASGWNYSGFRVGLQALFLENRLSVGFNYRHKVSADIQAIAPSDVSDLGREDPESGTPIILGAAENSVSTTFNLPARMSFGVRYDHPFGKVTMGYAVDMEYAFNSQNRQENIIAAPNAQVLYPDGVPNIFAWNDAITVRLGLEARIHEVGRGDLSARLGYAYDQQTSPELYASAFGTPPGPTHIGSLGVGYDAGPWELNFGYAFRHGSAEVLVPSGYSSLADARTNGDPNVYNRQLDPSDPDYEDRPVVDGAIGNCSFCGFPGSPAITLHGIYIDFSYTWEREQPSGGDEPWEEASEPGEMETDAEEPIVGVPASELDDAATDDAATDDAATDDAATDDAATDDATTHEWVEDPAP